MSKPTVFIVNVIQAVFGHPQRAGPLQSTMAAPGGVLNCKDFSMFQVKRAKLFLSSHWFLKARYCDVNGNVVRMTDPRWSVACSSEVQGAAEQTWAIKQLGCSL